MAPTDEPNKAIGRAVAASTFKAGTIDVLLLLGVISALSFTLPRKFRMSQSH